MTNYEDVVYHRVSLEPLIENAFPEAGRKGKL